MTAMAEQPRRRLHFGNVLGRANTLSRKQELALLTSVWAATTAWVWLRMNQGWVPHDDGAFAESALRVLDGQLPHREFAELYTGAMTFLNAGAFLVLGEDLFSLRVPLFVLFLGFVPSVYYIARRFVTPIPAALTAIVAITWAVPVYPAAVPSWYLLLFSVYGAAALMRWRETNSDRWLWVAGICGGLAVAFKIVGLYFVIAALYFLLCSAEGEHFVGQHRARLRRPLLGFMAVVAGVTFAGFIVASVLRSNVGVPELANLTVPIVALSISILVWPWPAVRRFPEIRTQARRIVVFSIGVASPIVLLIVPYVWAGALGDLLEGVFVSPQSRREYAYLGTPGPVFLLPAAMVIALLVLRSRLQRRGRNLLDAGAAVFIGLVLVAAVDGGVGYSFFWSVGRGMATVTVVVGALVLVRSRGEDDSDRREFLLLLLALVAFTALVQFPFAGPVYYCYVAPLAVLATVALVAQLGSASGVLPTALLAAFAVFGAAFLDRTSVPDLGTRFRQDPQVQVLGDNASIRVEPSVKRQLDEVTRLLRRHGRGRYVYAGPDLPHVYFLSGFENPTRSLFDFLDTENSARRQALLRALRDKEVTTIAINRDPDLSEPLEPATRRELVRIYPIGKRIGSIDVRWKVRVGAALGGQT